MIAFIRGKLVTAGTDFAVIETGGIGYEVMMPAASLARLPSYGSTITLHTYLYVREDNLGLFGFLDAEDLSMFRKLITVSGVGPKAALAILSVMDADALKIAIVSEDAKAISKAPGVGAKTAHRLIIELKDKIELSVDNTHAGPEAANAAPADSGAAEDAVLALTALGYSQSDAFRAVRSVEDVAALDSQQLLKKALKKIMLF